MRAVFDILDALILLTTLALVSSCYAHTGTPPGPSCSQDPTQQGCYPPLSDDKKKPK